jgi:hypothetical protein
MTPSELETASTSALEWDLDNLERVGRSEWRDDQLATYEAIVAELAYRRANPRVSSPTVRGQTPSVRESSCGDGEDTRRQASGR